MDELNEMFDKLNIVSDILNHHDDVEHSESLRVIEELPMMLNQINEICADCPDLIKPELVVNYIYAMKKFNDEIKPIYLAFLLIKEGQNANN